VEGREGDNGDEHDKEACERERRRGLGDDWEDRLGAARIVVEEWMLRYSFKGSKKSDIREHNNNCSCFTYF